MSSIETETFTIMTTILQQIAKSPPSDEQADDFKHLTNALSELALNNSLLGQPLRSALANRVEAERLKFASVPPTSDVLNHDYTLHQEEKISQFLSQHQSLLKILEEAPSQIRKYFPVSQNPELVLELLADPDISDYEELFILIVTQYDAETAIKNLEKLNEFWWFKIPFDERSELSIDVKFKKI
jgi:hypothetical protein